MDLETVELVLKLLGKELVIEGSCNYCGKCCYPSGITCNFLDTFRVYSLSSNFCRLGDNRPQSCKDYPKKEDFLLGVVPKECGFKLVLREIKETE